MDDYPLVTVLAPEGVCYCSEVPMRITILALLTIAALCADTVTLTSTRSSALQSCGNFQDCQPFDILIPQFDPARGTPQSITWAFADSQSYYGGYNDIGATEFGDFTWTTTEGDMLSAPLGAQASNSQNLSASINPYNTRNVSFGGWWASGVVEANGVVEDSSQWIGQGEVEIQVTPFLFASNPQGDGAGQVNTTSLNSIMDDVTLTVTADYGQPAQTVSRFSRLVAKSPVPEPGLRFPLVLLVVLMGAMWSKGKRRE